MRLPTERAVGVGFAVAVAVLAANAAITYSNLRTLSENNWWVAHTREVLGELESTLSALKDAETGQRGYLLTGREDYLEPYHGAVAQIGPHLDRLAKMTVDNPRQQARIPALRQTVAERMAIIQETIELRRRPDLDAALAVVASNRGKHLMDQARRQVAEMQAEEDRLLGLRSEASRSSIRWTIATFSLASGLAVLTVALVYALNRRHVAERERQAEQVRRSERWLATTLASIGDAVIATDTRGAVSFLNPVAQALTGWNPDEARGVLLEDVFRIINEATRQPAEHPVAKVLREGRVVGLANHTLLIARDGSETPIDDSGAPIVDERGEVAGVVMVFRDVAERRRNEQERERLIAAEQKARAEAERARDEAEAANRAKDQFLAVLSHELRTPLNPILLAVTEMLDQMAPYEDIRPTLLMIRQNVQLEARLIDDLLDVMRIVRGKMPMHWEVADAHALIRQAVDICRSDIGSGRLRLELDLTADTHHVNADPSRLQQVFWNLIKNAVKFTPPGGSLAIRTRNAPAPGGDSGGARLVVEVSDTGIGIEPDLLPVIFDAFQQGETTLTRQFGGLGLGLAISRSVVEAHGGSLVAESPGKGQGATFRVEMAALPRAMRQEPSGEAPVAPRPARLRILLVEDDATTLGVLDRLLRKLGYEVTTAATLGSALEAARAEEFDLIVSDIGLPDGTGLDLMREVGSHRPVPAIALTGYGREEDIRLSREAGFTAHMTKPIDFMRLEAVIRRVASLGPPPS
jgi:PAS domain S-box-containing protein